LTNTISNGILYNMNHQSPKTLQMYELESAKGLPIDQIIQEALDTSPDRNAAATLLGITRQTLVDWLRRLGMADMVREYHKAGGNGR